ncbi:hypothetical protein DT376_36035, partial [Pseudomonas aeruginosa]
LLRRLVGAEMCIRDRGSDAASADGEATTKDGLKIGNGSLRLRQDDPGPTRESPLRDPRLNPYAPRQP